MSNNSADKKQIRIIVRGDVQGVGFRFACKRMAESLGIKGWVKNTSGGDVEIIAEGTEIQLNAFISWCYQGPVHARVKDVFTENIDKTITYNCFDIRH